MASQFPLRTSWSGGSGKTSSPRHAPFRSDSDDNSNSNNPMRALMTSPAQIYSTSLSFTTALASTFASSSANRSPLSASSSSGLADSNDNHSSGLHHRTVGKTASSKRDLPPLFWYMEAGRWDKATQRAKRHPREFKTWVTIKTKSAAHANASDNHTTTLDHKADFSTSTGTKRLALHHACFKLRSAGALPSPEDDDDNREMSDPFVQACEFIWLLVTLYPAAAGQRESRHGCLPLHLCAFASCAARSSEQQHTSGTDTVSSETTSSSGSSPLQQQQQQPWSPYISSTSPAYSLHRPSIMSNRCASDTTTITNMSAIHAEETMSGGMNDAKVRRQMNLQQPLEHHHALYHHNKHNHKQQQHTTPTTTTTKPAVSVAMRSPHLKISPTREAAAVKVMNALLDAYPKAIRMDSEGGRLPLHTACAGRATPAVVATLVTAYPAAARHRNKDGFLPLHLAAHWGVSHPAVAIALLKAYPDATVGRNRWERTPLEEALCMAGENGRPHQAALVRALRKHPSFWTQPVADLFAADTRKAAAARAPVDVDESLASTTEDEDQQQQQQQQDDQWHHLYAPSPRERAVLEEVGDEFGGQEVVAYRPRSSSASQQQGSFVGRLVSGIKPPLGGAKQQQQRDNNDAWTNNAAQLPLGQLIQHCKWPAVLRRIQTHPLEPEDELKVVTRGGFTASTGFTALHYACERNPPLEVVQALQDAYPMAVLTRCMPGGCLPLHVACTWHAAPAVVEALLYSDPGSVKVRDELGNVALHSACFSGMDVAVVLSLLTADPKAVVARNHQGSRPIDICKRLRHDNRKVVLSMLTQKGEELFARYHDRHRRLSNNSSGGWSAVAKEAEELNQRCGSPDHPGSGSGLDMHELEAAVEVTFEQHTNKPELEWI